MSYLNKLSKKLIVLLKLFLYMLGVVVIGLIWLIPFSIIMGMLIDFNIVALIRLLIIYDFHGLQIPQYL